VNTEGHEKGYRGFGKALKDSDGAALVFVSGTHTDQLAPTQAWHFGLKFLIKINVEIDS
jgi:hypothetical protein